MPLIHDHEYHLRSVNLKRSFWWGWW